MEIQKEGWLHKRGEHIKTWRARYFILKIDGFFLGYNSKPSKDDEPNNVFYIKNCTVLITDKPKLNSFILKINSSEKLIERFFAAYGLNERNKWIEAIQIVASKLNGNFQLESLVPKKEKVALDDFEYLKIIGKGHFGKVILTREKSTGQIYAVKILKKSLISEQKKIDHTKTENHVLKSLRNPFITSLVYSFQTKDLLCLVMEYVSGGDLFFHLTREHKFTEDKSRFYCAEICYAIGYLHEHDIIYRDLKLENILLDSKGHIKLADFGLCKTNMTNESKTDTFCGTIEYLAPEILLKEITGEGYTRAIDWWTVGIVLYEMLTGKLPFSCKVNNVQCQKGLFEKILNENLTIPFEISASTRLFLNGLLKKDPSKRLGSRQDFEEVKGHEFYKTLDWERLKTKQLDPPFVPKLTNEIDTCYFDKEFTSENVHFSPPEDSFMNNHFESFSYYGSRTSLFSRHSKTSSIKSKDKFDLEMINEEDKLGERHKKVYYYKSNEIKSFEDFLEEINRKRDNLMSSASVVSSRSSNKSNLSSRSVYSVEMFDL